MGTRHFGVLDRPIPFTFPELDIQRSGKTEAQDSGWFEVTTVLVREVGGPGFGYRAGVANFSFCRVPKDRIYSLV